MIAIIVILLLSVIGAVLTIYFWQRMPSGKSSEDIAFPGFEGGLFDRSHAERVVENKKDAIASDRRKLIERAEAGDLEALTEANSTRDANLYKETLNALIEWASAGQENLAALVSHVSKSNELRANSHLARLSIRMWKTAPDRRSTTQMVHMSALSDDPETYALAVESTLELWRLGELKCFTPGELAELLVSQYWVIAPEARRGGAGFALKHRLLNVRRELETARSA